MRRRSRARRGGSPRKRHGATSRIDAGLAQKFRRAAAQRLISAELLLKHNLALDAVYLGGYVAECALKALILRRTPESRIYSVTQRISRGAVGHKLEVLKAILSSTGANVPHDIWLAFSRVNSWNTDLRYEVGFVRYNEAVEFLQAASTILKWVVRSW